MTTSPVTPHLHAADEPELVRSPTIRYAAVLGSGAPGSDEFYRKKLLVADVARALAAGGADPAVEIQYWYPEGSAHVEIADFYSINPVPSLEYRVLAAIPDDTAAEELAAARERAASTSDAAGDAVELFMIPAQDVVQVMHHGPFADEFATLAKLGAFAAARGLHRHGPHHEVHLDAFRRDTPQGSLRTILRDPVA